ncbi:helix-turn-helix domain-containing protein [Sediminitomix flava]|uniref:AraC family transcriptional regulator n=1 Tax=Sediminitomix flava TaxID=379075 RepID=A0A315ZD87_SEDFL|nr:helix-turn-helix transcriptional regulator [Sediminitomix flava]PWJ42674.1 AraC family transcriptional regulator [Sediminitomix flava]
MNFDNQVIFFFSALGAFNGFLLSFYFAIAAKKRKFSNYFLALLILTLSVRIIKSVFFYFNPQLTTIFIQIGLSACALIGPFLFLYLKQYTTKEKLNWAVHTLPYLTGITILGAVYSYMGHRGGWSLWIVRSIYIQWFIYILLSFRFIKPSLKKLLNRENLKNKDAWVLSLFFGVTFVWLVYNIGVYTSYYIGAISFSFVLYIIVLLFVFRNNKQSTFFEEKEKYSNKRIENEVSKMLETGLTNFIENEMFLAPDMTLEKMANQLNVSKHTLSQFLNENMDKSFSNYVNELRVEKAKERLLTINNYTIEGIAYECGFNSKSTFYTAFKKVVGLTPAQFRKENSH